MFCILYIWKANKIWDALIIMTGKNDTPQITLLDMIIPIFEVVLHQSSKEKSSFFKDGGSTLSVKARPSRPSGKSTVNSFLSALTSTL